MRDAGWWQWWVDNRENSPRDVVDVSWAIVCFFLSFHFFLLTFFSSYRLILLCQHVTEDTSNTTAPWETHDDDAMGGWRGEWPRKHCRRLLGYSIFFFFFFSFIVLFLFLATNYDNMPPNMTTPRGTQDDDDSVVCFLYLIFLLLIFSRYYDNALRPPPTVWWGWGRNNGVSRHICVSSSQVFFFFRFFFLLDYAMCMEWGTATILGAQWRKPAEAPSLLLCVVKLVNKWRGKKGCLLNIA